MDFGSIEKHFREQPPKRVVSLVPSLTESIFDLGLGENLVGVTDYCSRPKDQLKSMPRVGGPQDARLESVVELEPDLVISALEENAPSLIEHLEVSGIPVWTVNPRSVRTSVNVLWQMANLFQNNMALMHLIPLETSLEWIQASGEDGETWTYFCPIWMEVTAEGETWWMTFNRETYPSDLLRYFGGVNVFADRVRRYPLAADLGHETAEPTGERDTRYPRLSVAEIRKTQPEVILLPDEPFAFGIEHESMIRERFADIPAVLNNRLIRLDGSLITWYGTRLARALIDLPGILGV